MPSASAFSEISRAVRAPAPRRRSIAVMFETPARPSGSIHWPPRAMAETATTGVARSEEHTSELQSLTNLVCRLLLEKKKKYENRYDRVLQRDNSCRVYQRRHHASRSHAST